MVEIGRDVTLRSDDFLAEDHHTVLVEQKIFRTARADDIFRTIFKDHDARVILFPLDQNLGSPWVPMGLPIWILT
jgi:hypothetical protein